MNLNVKYLRNKGYSIFHRLSDLLGRFWVASC
jgi:hypothetical protein